MPNRMDVELTSRTDGAWTWRAAGARQPRGTVPENLVPAGASPGDVFRAEVESGLDGLEVLSLVPPKGPSEQRGRGDRIEVLGVPHRGSDVAVILAPERGRRSDRKGRGDRGDRGDRDRRETRGRRNEDSHRSARERPPRDRRGQDGDRRDGAPRRDRRPAMSTAHRNAALAGLRPEQLPVAEQLLRGGMPAVRQALAEQVARARQEGRPPVAEQPILAMAEELLPVVNLAAWKDRAASAMAAGRDLRLRELRTIVAASRTVSLDEEGQTMAKSLRETLDRRVQALREDWVHRMTKALDQDRPLDALTEVAHPPEPGTRCPADVAVRLTDAAGQAMRADLDPDAWMALLEAVVETPVRRNVKPAGIPDDPGVRAAARNAAGLLPELAKLLGIRIPPPPPRRRITVRTPSAPPRGASGAAGS